MLFQLEMHVRKVISCASGKRTAEQGSAILGLPYI
jgi:hypothetical protein